MPGIYTARRIKFSATIPFEIQSFYSNLMGLVKDNLPFQRVKYDDIKEFLAYCCVHHHKNIDGLKSCEQGSWAKKSLSKEDYTLLHSKLVGDFLTASDEAFILFKLYNNIGEGRTNEGHLYYEFPSPQGNIRFAQGTQPAQGREGTLAEGLAFYHGVLHRVNTYRDHFATCPDYNTTHPRPDLFDFLNLIQNPSELEEEGLVIDSLDVDTTETYADTSRGPLMSSQSGAGETSMVDNRTLHDGALQRTSSGADLDSAVIQSQSHDDTQVLGTLPFDSNNDENMGEVGNF